MTAIPKDDSAALLSRMWLIRAFEEKASELFARGEIAGLIHLGIGHEGSAVGACSALARRDLVFGSHRSHAHALAKGADPTRLMAELAGRAAGYCKGKGGSMHISAMDVGFVTATGVVGGNIPLALGGALHAQTTGTDHVAIAFFGDGAGQTGSFHESLNLAVLWSLPVVFVCENNGYAEFSPLSDHTVVSSLSEYSGVYQMPSVTVDGGDVLAIRNAVDNAVARARSGDGPTFVECLTYRLRGHYEGDTAKYRELISEDHWVEKDPIARFIAQVGHKIDSERIEADARSVIDQAVADAMESDPTSVDEAEAGVYAV